MKKRVLPSKPHKAVKARRYLSAMNKRLSKMSGVNRKGGFSQQQRRSPARSLHPAHTAKLTVGAIGEAISKAWKTRKARYGPTGRRRPSVKAQKRRQQRRYRNNTTRKGSFGGRTGGISHKSYYQYYNKNQRNKRNS